MITIKYFVVSLAAQCPLLTVPQPTVAPNLEAMIGTCVINPIMGHVQLSLVSPLHISNRLQAAAAYDLNVHSFDSDLTLGLSYHPANADNVRSDAVRLGFSWRYGMGFSLASQISDNLAVKFGLATGPIWYRPSGIECLPSPRTSWRSDRPLIGLELSYVSSV